MTAVEQAMRGQDFPWGAAAILILLAVLLGGLARLGSEPLQLELYGDFDRTGAEAVAEALAPHLDAGFFVLSASRVEQVLSDLPWLQRVESEFLWPNRLALRLDEHEPLANLAAGGVLTRLGEPLAVDVVPGLTAVTAPAHRYGDVASVLGQVAEGCADCRISSLTLHRGGQLGLRLQWPDGEVAVELGRPDWGLALRRLAEDALPALRPELAQVAAIDLRYRHGFAVRWVDAGGRES